MQRAFSRGLVSTCFCPLPILQLSSQLSHIKKYINQERSAAASSGAWLILTHPHITHSFNTHQSYSRLFTESTKEDQLKNFFVSHGLMESIFTAFAHVETGTWEDTNLKVAQRILPSMGFGETTPFPCLQLFVGLLGHIAVVVCFSRCQLFLWKRKKHLL